MGTLGCADLDINNRLGNACQGGFLYVCLFLDCLLMDRSGNALLSENVYKVVAKSF